MFKKCTKTGRHIRSSQKSVQNVCMYKKPIIFSRTPCRAFIFFKDSKVNNIKSLRRKFFLETFKARNFFRFMVGFIQNKSWGIFIIEKKLRSEKFQFHFKFLNVFLAKKFEAKKCP